MKSNTPLLCHRCALLSYPNVEHKSPVAYEVISVVLSIRVHTISSEA